MKARRITARRLIGGVAVVLPALLVAGFLYIRSATPQLELGTGYAARVACACRYIGNRDLKSCRADFEPGMEPIRLSDDPATKTVTAWVPMIASRSARYDPVLGCQPEPFRGRPLEVR